jgi:hypothetical protein
MPQFDEPVGPTKEDRALPEGDPRTLRSSWRIDEEAVATAMEYGATRRQAWLDALHEENEDVSRRAVARIAYELLKAADWAAAARGRGAAEERAARTQLDVAIGIAQSDGQDFLDPVTSACVAQTEGDDAKAAADAASLLRHVVCLFTEQSEAGRRELARLAEGSAAHAGNVAQRRRRVLGGVEAAKAALYERAPEAGDAWPDRSVGAAALDRSRATEEAIEGTARALQEGLAADIPEMANVPLDAISDLLRRADPKGTRPIAAPYLAAALCVLARALEHGCEEGETVEQAARRQAPLFRHARGRNGDRAKATCAVPPTA